MNGMIHRFNGCLMVTKRNTGFLKQIDQWNTLVKNVILFVLLLLMGTVAMLAQVSPGPPFSYAAIGLDWH